MRSGDCEFGLFPSTFFFCKCFSAISTTSVLAATACGSLTHGVFRLVLLISSYSPAQHLGRSIAEIFSPHLGTKDPPQNSSADSHSFWCAKMVFCQSLRTWLSSKALSTSMEQNRTIWWRIQHRVFYVFLSPMTQMTTIKNNQTKKNTKRMGNKLPPYHQQLSSRALSIRREGFR